MVGDSTSSDEFNMSELDFLTLAAAKYDYNPETGVFTYKKNGKEAGYWCQGKVCKTHNKYYFFLSVKVGELKYKKVRAHRLAWFIVNGEVPDIIDHIEPANEKNRYLNRIANLRSVDMRTNNSENKVAGTSEYVGVYWSKRDQKWSASIKVGDTYKNLGRFEVEEEAATRYQEVLALYKKEGAQAVLDKYARKMRSQYDGVTWHKSSERWRAYIYSNGKQKSLGYYDDELEAAAVYQKALESLKIE